MPLSNSIYLSFTRTSSLDNRVCLSYLLDDLMTKAAPVLPAAEGSYWSQLWMDINQQTLPSIEIFTASILHE